MRLISRVILRLSIALLLLLAAWATMFYYIMVDEINDETDDSLDEYSELIIMRALAGKELPAADNGTNNSYYMREVTAEYALQVPHVQYLDQEIYIESIKDMEPARVLRTIFRDGNGRYYELTVMIPSFERADLMETVLWWIVLLYVVLLLALIALNAWVIFRSLRPLYALLKWLDKLTLGSALPPLKNDTKVTEFRRLNEAMLRNAQRNNEMYEEQQSFIGNASHEIQTPLAVGINRLEIFASDPSLTEEQLGAVLEVGRTLDHLSKLNRTLLLLTKIENRQIPESSEVDVNRLVEQLAADCSEVYAGLGINVDIHEEAPLKFVMNDSLASTLFGNLIKNAFLHSPCGGTIEINVSSRTFSVSNTAEDGPLDGEQIFRRFWQGGKRTGSMGLGLPMAESICRLYGLRIAYNYKDGIHRFSIYF